MKGGYVESNDERPTRNTCALASQDSGGSTQRDDSDGLRLHLDVLLLPESSCAVYGLAASAARRDHSVGTFRWGLRPMTPRRAGARSPHTARGTAKPCRPERLANRRYSDSRPPLRTVLPILDSVVQTRTPSRELGRGQQPRPSPPAQQSAAAGRDRDQ